MNTHPQHPGTTRMNRELSICIAQINYDSAHIRAHLERLKAIIRDQRQADLIIFPELILHGHPSLEKPEGFLYRKLKAIYGGISQDLYRFIREQDARVIFGELRRQGDLYFNLATYADRHGPQHYAKCHVHWTEHFTPGREIKVFETPLGRIGVSICFDAAFAEVWRVQALMGADLLVNIAAVPATFPVRQMWRRLVGAAVFNQRPVIYANRPGSYFSGHSAIFDAQGELVLNADGREAIVRGQVSLDEAATWREEEPIFPHRRPQLYREITTRSAPRPRRVSAGGWGREG